MIIYYAFIGAIDMVTGSATLIEYKNESKGILNYYLVDCGKYQNENKNVTENRNFVLSIAKKINSCTYGSCRFTAGFD